MVKDYGMDKIKGNVEKRRWLWFHRNTVNNGSNCSNRIFSFFSTYRKRISTYAQNFYRKNERYKKFGLLSDIRGGVTSIEVLIYVPIIAFLLFNGVDYYLTSVQHNNLENRKNFYLDVIRIEGTYTSELDSQIRAELNAMGFKDVDIDVSRKSGGTNFGLMSGEYVYRNIDEPDESRIFLSIKAKPNFQPFILGRLLGVKEDDSFMFVVKGEALSEKSYYEEEP